MSDVNGVGKEMSRVIQLLVCKQCEKGPCYLCQYNFQDFCYGPKKGRIKWEIVTDNLEVFINRKEELEKQMFYFLEQPQELTKNV